MLHEAMWMESTLEALSASSLEHRTWAIRDTCAPTTAFLLLIAPATGCQKVQERWG